MSSFWWEDGYDPNLAATEKTTKKDSVKCDGTGETFLLSRLETSAVHRLDACFLPYNNNYLITLNNAGRRFFSMSHYTLEQIDKGVLQLVEQRSVPVAPNTGYFGLSRNGQIIAAAVLKTDSISIIDRRNDDLLVDIDGSRKTGYWGKILFLPPLDASSQDLSNAMVELRVLKMDRSNPKESILRLWDLGFRVPLDGYSSVIAEDPDEDDEVASVVWDLKLPAGFCSICATATFIILTIVKSEKLSIIQWIDRATGTKIREIKLLEWCSKPILSSDGSLAAFAHIGRCSIRASASGTLLAEVAVPGMPVPFPVVPLGFIENSRYLAMRVDLDKMFVLSEWAGSCSSSTSLDPAVANTIVIGAVGGTISGDSVCLSHDSRYLVCWPYGSIEVYDLLAITRKLQVRLRFVVLRLALLCRANRAAPLVGRQLANFVTKLAPLDFRLLRYILNYI